MYAHLDKNNILKKILKELFSNIIIMAEIINFDFEIKEEQIATLPKKRGRHISNPDRWLANGKYNDHPLDPEYFKKYYREHFAHSHTCEICGTVLANTQKIQRHQNAKKCQKRIITNPILDSLTL